jgi:hypothetical protein
MSFLISATPPFVVCLVFPTGAPGSRLSGVGAYGSLGAGIGLMMWIGSPPS